MNNNYNFQTINNIDDKKLNDFLYNEYILTKDKLSTIKKGVEKFEVDLLIVKKMVDLIADEVYKKEQAENKAIPTKELPTNGIVKKPAVKNMAIIGYCILIFLLATQVRNENFKTGLIITFLVGTAIFIYMILSYFNTPTNPHVFPFSLSKYFIHNLIYKILFMVLALYLPTRINFVNGILSLVYYGIIVILGVIFFIQLIKKTTEQFRVEYGNIEYSHQIVDYFTNNAPNDNDPRSHTYKSWVSYNIYSITKVEETFNYINIYGYIEKTISRITPDKSGTSKPKRLDKIKITKSFKNTSNLIRALNMCVKPKDK